MSRLVRGALTAALFMLVACSTSSPSSSGGPQLQTTSRLATFSGCPSTDTPDEQRVNVTNAGSALAKMTVSVAGAQAEDFKPVFETVPSELAPGASATIAVRYQPVSVGQSTAQLIIEDGNEKTPVLSVALQGKSEDLGDAPTLQVSLQSKDDPNLLTECYAGGTCMPTFADTFFGQSTTLKIKLHNKGCPSLKITSAALIKDPNYASETLPFYLDEPAVLPTAISPWLIPGTGDTQEMTLVARFSPEEDSSNDGQRYGALQLTTNDPLKPIFNITLFGYGIKPDLSVDPSVCDFSDVQQTCGNVSRVQNEARFRIKNAGTGPLTIGSITFEKGGQGRFTLPQNPQGTTLAPDTETFLVAKHVDQTLYVSDRVIIDAGPAGTVSAELFGGKPPAMSTDPDIQLDFGSSLEPITEKTLHVRAGTSGGALILHRVWVETSSSFGLVSPVPADTRVEAGQSFDIRVAYRRPAAGGQQIGAIHLETNDPRYSAHKVVTLYSQTPGDPPPTSVLTGCTPGELTTKPLCHGGSTGAMTVSLAQLGTVRQITVSGVDSYDLAGPTEQRPVSEYEFRLFRKPSSAGAAAKLENDGVRTAKPTAVLTLDPSAAGEYRVLLRTYDDQKQASGWAELRVYAQ